MFTAMQSGPIVIYLINEDNLGQVNALFSGYADSELFLRDIAEFYAPEYEDGKRTNFGFYTTLDGQLAGLTQLNIHSWRDFKGSTGADVLAHMRGKGVTPGSKPFLFYLAFEILGLNRVETGCFVSNVSSRRSIEKTRGFRLEGVMRESGMNEKGEFEDEYLYAILKSDWLQLYNKNDIQILY